MTFEESTVSMFEKLINKISDLEAKSIKAEEATQTDEEQKANEPDPEVINAFIQNI